MTETGTYAFLVFFLQHKRFSQSNKSNEKDRGGKKDHVRDDLTNPHLGLVGVRVVVPLATELVEVPFVACVPWHGDAVDLQEVRRLRVTEKKK
jgi:hypothetical protein